MRLRPCRRQRAQAPSGPRLELYYAYSKLKRAEAKALTWSDDEDADDIGPGSLLAELRTDQGLCHSSQALAVCVSRHVARPRAGLGSGLLNRGGQHG